MKKKILSLVFVSMVIIALTGCGAGDKYIIATDAAYAPMEFMDKGEITGFDADLIVEIMKEADLEYELRNVGWETLLTGVKDGSELDAAISSVTISEERKESYDFSVPYYESTNMILVPEDSTIASAADLKDKKVAVQNSTTAADIADNLLGADNANVKKFDSNSIALLELQSGGVDAVIADNAIINEYIKNNPDKKFKGFIDDSFSSEYYGVLFPKGSGLKEKVDGAVKTVIENGTYAKVYKKWFGEEPDVEKLLQQM